MLYITRATTNTLYVTCKEKQLLSNPYYLLKFKNVPNKQERFCICTDSSSYPDRYQKLTLIENNDPAVSTNQIKLDTQGTWYFWIYEQSSSTNIDPTGLTEVESGFATVNHTATVLPAYTGYTSTYKQYNG